VADGGGHRQRRSAQTPKELSGTSPLIVIGAGASGLMAALWAAHSGREVIVLEGTVDGGRKILISGGGRCNILPAEVALGRFVTGSSPHALRNILKSWPLAEQVRFFEGDLSLKLVAEAASGKLFPARMRAREVRDALVNEARRRGAQVRFSARVADLVREGAAWRVRLNDGDTLNASAVVLATGGRSVPTTGSDGWGFEVLARMGHTIRPTYPALVPLTAAPPRHGHLAGLSLEVVLTAEGAGGHRSERGGFLFTHKGYSGPAVLNVSHVAAKPRGEGEPRGRIFVNWACRSAAEWDEDLRRGSGTVESAVARLVPARLAKTLCEEAGVPEGARLPELRREDRRRVVGLLTRYALPWTGTEGYAKAEVTGGGVDLGDVDPRTMESRTCPGLFICGEALDAFGPIGGHNFQWAWATGRAAGLGAARGKGQRPGSRA
jgi:predicted Rossmann fold flavoprotein